MDRPGTGRRRPRLRFTSGRRKRFLRVLAATSDVEAACAEADLDWEEVCEVRLREPDFAAEIQETIAAGYDRLEARILMLAEAALAPAGGKPDPSLAIMLLKQRRGERPGRTARAATGRRPVRSSPQRDKAIAAILDKVAAAERRAEAGRHGQEERRAPAQRQRPGAGASKAERR